MSVQVTQETEGCEKNLDKKHENEVASLPSAFDQQVFAELLNKQQFGKILYTDASKSDNNVGCAIIEGSAYLQQATLFISILFPGLGWSKRVAENIQKLQVQFGRHNLPYKSAELFLLKSKINEPKSSVCGFFPLDWTLVYSMVAGITTYLVYLVQFREMEIERKKSFL
ncbi:hypothetical protein HHI36_022014 [Cryptolaemus montrouzieri]|uniref:Uncharacterized protein n=1 Tax=Cryptolaemus montrouzieri TaxID=559131 RepID=A0ABD2MZ90_9CUCU